MAPAGVAVAVIALSAVACGGSDIIAGKFAPGSATASASAPAGSPAGSAGRATPARRPHRVLDLGRPGRDQEPAGDRRRVHGGEPDGHGQRDRLGLGSVLGQAPDRSRRRRRPDVFAMDGPLGPDYQTRDVLLDLTPYIEGESYDLSQLDDNAVKDFTTADGRSSACRAT